MESYHALASYYDLLINEEEAQEKYLSFTLEHSHGENYLELACGSGTLAAMLQEARPTIHMRASDLSAEMIEVASSQYAHLPIEFYQMDMCLLGEEEQYDTITCFCDSLNYVTELAKIEQMFQGVFKALKKQGVFLFDAHSMDRLEEFKEEYDENYMLDELEYTWHIVSKEDFIYQTLRVWDDSVIPTYFFEEKHVQKVYQPLVLKELLEKIGFSVQIITDFNKEGIVPGEKQFFICKKEG